MHSVHDCVWTNRSHNISLRQNLLTAGTGVVEMDEKLGAAKRRFPERWRAIEERAFCDEDFRSLCADLADAEAAAVQWANSPSPKRDQRQAEYLCLAVELTKEIEAILDAASIIPLGGRRPKTPS
jgi:hypothetical protein